MSRFASTLAVTLFLLFLVFYGACISGIVLKEPDICFLLASGRWIVEHGQVMHSDPFSYTTGFAHQPYVIEKWLADVIFFASWKWLSAAGMLVVTACIMAFTFVVMPFRILALQGIKGWQSFAIVFLSVLVSFSRLTVRPEIFSYLFIAIYLELFLRLSARAGPGTTPKLWWQGIASFAGIMVLWCNMHTLFIFAPMLLAAYSLCMAGEKIFWLKDEKIDWTAPLALILCLIASLANPYGANLWPSLSSMFGAYTATNNEEKPLTWASFLVPVYYPFFLLALISAICLVRKGLSKPLKRGQLFFRLLIAAGIVGGIRTARSGPIADLFMVSGLASILDSSGRPSGSPSPMSQALARFCDPASLRWSTTFVAATAIGSYLLASILPPEFPQGSAAFTPPLAAIEYIGKEKPKGHMLNDPHFGTVMMWQLYPAPPVFIDVRYNLYGNVFNDYWTMVLCRNGWENLMQKYGIEWIFLPPDLALVKKLENDPGWTVRFRDKSSVIISRSGKEKSD